MNDIDFSYESDPCDPTGELSERVDLYTVPKGWFSDAVNVPDQLAQLRHVPTDAPPAQEPKP